MSQPFRLRCRLHAASKLWIPLLALFGVASECFGQSFVQGSMSAAQEVYRLQQAERARELRDPKYVEKRNARFDALLDQFKNARLESNRKHASQEIASMIAGDELDGVPVGADRIKSAVAEWSKLLKSKDVGTRKEAVERVVRFGSLDNAPDMIAAMTAEKRDAELQWLFADAAAKLGDKMECVKYFKRAALDPKNKNRHNAIRELGTIGGDNAKAALRTIQRTAPNLSIEVDAALDKADGRAN